MDERAGIAILAVGKVLASNLLLHAELAAE